MEERVGALVLAARTWTEATDDDRIPAILDGVRDLGLGALLRRGGEDGRAQGGVALDGLQLVVEVAVELERGAPIGVGAEGETYNINADTAAGAIAATFLVKGAANYGQAMLMSFVGLRIVADFQNRSTVQGGSIRFASFFIDRAGLIAGGAATRNDRAGLVFRT